MKIRLSILLCILMLLSISGCAAPQRANITATTLPVWEFTNRLCNGTDLTVEKLINEPVSCLHDYTLQVDQMQFISTADMVILSGAGLESFMSDALSASNRLVDASVDVSLHEDHHHGHHDADPHIWLSPENAKVMVQTIYKALCLEYPQHQTRFTENLESLISDLDELQTYGESTLSQLSCRELITFHDGFAYFAESFDLQILQSVEEESGSEASAQTLIRLIDLVQTHQLPAIFIETNGASSAAEIISTETSVSVFTLDMAMSGDSYFDSMYHNIDTIQEALQ